MLEIASLRFKATGRQPGEPRRQRQAAQRIPRKRGAAATPCLPPDAD